MSSLFLPPTLNTEIPFKKRIENFNKLGHEILLGHFRTRTGVSHTRQTEQLFERADSLQVYSIIGEENDTQVLLFKAVLKDGRVVRERFFPGSLERLILINENTGQPIPDPEVTLVIPDKVDRPS